MGHLSRLSGKQTILVRMHAPPLHPTPAPIARSPHRFDWSFAFSVKAPGSSHGLEYGWKEHAEFSFPLAEGPISLQGQEGKHGMARYL